ncbi:MAG: ABC transporter substrate-binding protein [Eubacterium sp.]
MRIKQIGALLLVVILLMTGLTGCGNSTGQGASSTLTEEEGYVIVKDMYGKEIKVKQNPQYVASIFASATHVLSLFGDTQKIVAISQGNTRDYLYCKIFPEILNARVVKGNSSVNIEEMMKEPVPELIIINPEAALDDTAAKYFDKNNIPVLTVAFKNIEEQHEVINALGKIMGREERAQAYVDYSNEITKLVESRVSSIPEEQKKTLYHAINELLRTDSAESLSEDWLNQIGVVNVGMKINEDAGSLTSKNYVALEELLKEDPEYIIINGADVYDYIQTNENLHNLKAFKNNKIFIMPLGVTRWGHPNSIETPLAMLWTAKTVYPELFEDIDMRTETKEFYKTMFGYDLSEEEVDNILGGRVYKEIKGSGKSGL